MSDKRQLSFAFVKATSNFPA